MSFVRRVWRRTVQAYDFSHDDKWAHSMEAVY